VVNKRNRVTAVFAALADPTRRRILARLSQCGECRVTSLARPFHISLPGFSKHLRVLEHARLILRRRQGRLHLIRARAAGLNEAQQFMTQCAVFWDIKFDALDRLLEREHRKDRKR